MLTLVNGDKFRISPADPTSLEGYTLQADGKTLKQDFLPCYHRYMKQCNVCPATNKSKERPACSLKKITSCLSCVNCLERNKGPRSV